MSAQKPLYEVKLFFNRGTSPLLPEPTHAWQIVKIVTVFTPEHELGTYTYVYDAPRMIHEPGRAAADAIIEWGWVGEGSR